MTPSKTLRNYTTLTDVTWKSAETAFTACWPEIEKALAEGRTVLYAHEAFKGRLKISYPQFAKYVQKYRKKNQVVAHPAPAARIVAHKPSPSQQGVERQIPGADYDKRQQPGFYFDPTDIDTKKLI